MTQILISAIVGIMLFFTVVVAPTVFKVLPNEWSSAYVRSFFPKYYLALGLITFLAVFISPDLDIKVYLLICGALFLVSLLYLTPRINAAKDNHQNRRFHFLHMTSVIINMIQLAIYIYLLTRI